MKDNKFESLVSEVAKSIFYHLDNRGASDPDIDTSINIKAADGLSVIQIVEGETHEFLELRPILTEAIYGSHGIRYPGDDDADVSLATQLVIQKALEAIRSQATVV